MRHRFQTLIRLFAVIACLVHVVPTFARADVFADLESSLGAILTETPSPASPVGERPPSAFEIDVQVPNRPGYWNDFDPYLAVQRSAPAVGVTSEMPRSDDSPFTKDELKKVEVLISRLKQAHVEACRVNESETLDHVQFEIMRLQPGLESTHSAAEASLSDVERERALNDAKLKEAGRYGSTRESLENKAHALSFDAQDLKERSQRAANALSALRVLSVQVARCDSPTPVNVEMRAHRPPSGNYGAKPLASPSHEVLPKLKVMKGGLRP